MLLYLRKKSMAEPLEELKHFEILIKFLNVNFPKTV